MSERLVMLADDFNRADADPAGGPWVVQNGVSGNIKIVSNKIQTSSGIANGAEVMRNDVPKITQAFAQITLDTFTPTSGDGADCGVLLRCDPSGSLRQFYSIVAIEQVNGGFSSQIAKRVSGTFTSLATDNTGVWASGDVLYADAIGINPTVIRVFRNGVLLFTLNDSEATLQTFGLCGIRMRPITGAADVIADNFLAGIPGTPGARLGGLAFAKTPYQQAIDIGAYEDYLLR